MLEWLNEYRAILHLLLHVCVPALVAWLVVAIMAFQGRYAQSIGAAGFSWLKAFLILIGTMVVDADHLLATPIYAPGRCSIFFHPLHQLLPIVLYGLATVWPFGVRFLLGRPLSSRDHWIGWIGLGLLIHMGLDWSDCVWMRATA